MPISANSRNKLTPQRKRAFSLLLMIWMWLAVEFPVHPVQKSSIWSRSVFFIECDYPLYKVTSLGPLKKCVPCAWEEGFLMLHFGDVGIGFGRLHRMNQFQWGHELWLFMTFQLNVVFLHISRSTGVKADRKSRPSRDHTQKIRSTSAAGTQEEHKGHQDKVFVVIILAFFKFSSLLLLHTLHLVLNHRL